MTTISHTSQVSRQATSGSGYSSEGKNGWDHKLNSLLEDLHGTVIPGSVGGKDGASSEYREYRMTSSTRNNDDPPSTTEEKWIEYGTAGHPPTPSYLAGLDSRPSSQLQSSSTSRSLMDSRHKTNYSSRDDSHFGHTHSHSQMEFMDPVNTTVSLSSGQMSPLPPITRTVTTTSSPKVEKKEFYSKASYTTLIKGGQPPDSHVLVQDFAYPPEREHYPINRSENEYSRESSTKYSSIQNPVYTTPPRAVTKAPPIESSPTNTGLKTPPLVRKILQQSHETYGSHSHQKTQSSSAYNREHVTNYDDSFVHDGNKNVKFYNATTTRTETRDGTENIIRRFPSQTNIYSGSTEPPKRLDELLATFDESYVETSRIVGDGGGPHGSHPYGPGTRPVEQPQRVVRIDESRNVENEISRRHVVSNNNVDSYSRNVAGPPVYYPTRDNDQVYEKREESSEMMKGKGKAKAKMDRSYKAKEKSKSSHSEKGGGGALPVPVCLPVCCAAPCVIM